MVWFIWNILIEGNLLNPTFMVHINSRENASILFAINSNVNSQETIASIFSHSSDDFGREDDIEVFLLTLCDFGWMPFDESDTFSFVFERNDSVCEFSGFSPEDDFVMIEDAFFEEHSSGSSDVNFGTVFYVRMEDKFRLCGSEIVLDETVELLYLEEGFGKVLD